VPAGCEDICEKLAFDPATFFSWNHEFASLAELDQAETHIVEELPPRYDFF
jgi:methionyl-tRNA synthetase